MSRVKEVGVIIFLPMYETRSRGKSTLLKRKMLGGERVFISDMNETSSDSVVIEKR